MWNFFFDLSQSKIRSPTLPSLATDEEKKKKDETFAATSVPQAAHSWTHVIRTSLQRFSPKSCIYFDIRHLSHLCRGVSHKFSKVARGRFILFDWKTSSLDSNNLHLQQRSWFAMFCSQNLKSLPASGPSPPAVGATLEHPGDHLSRGWSVPALV